MLNNVLNIFIYTDMQQDKMFCTSSCFLTPGMNFKLFLRWENISKCPLKSKGFVCSVCRQVF